MLCTEKPLALNKSLRDRVFNLNQKQQLVACCKKVDGKLINQWFLV